MRDAREAIGQGRVLHDRALSGVVAAADPDEPYRPLVRIAGGEEHVDLRLPAAA